MPKNKKTEEEKGGGAPLWMVTYGDMMTLLLTFFVLLMSFSTMEVAKFKRGLASFKGAISLLPKQNALMERIPETLPPKEFSQGSSYFAKKRYDEEMESLQEQIEQKGLTDIINIEETGDGATIRIGDSALFDLGKANLKPDIFPVLDRITEMLEKGNEKVCVEGYTDNIPIHNDEFPSNWELSMARAMNVLRHLLNKGNVDPARVSAVGNGEYHPIVPNISPENQAKNRRVEIHISYKETVAGSISRQKYGRFNIETK